MSSVAEGRSVLVAAPTGSGKTAVAEFAVADALAANARAFYTTPLKALSNQKYQELCNRYGKERVGLLTGDNSVRSDASIVVMTTEVLRNMIYEGSTSLEELRWVVLDEIHYLQDPSRGAVWEEVIVHLPAHVGLVCLSATVSNADEVAAWIESVRGSTDSVVELERPVELVQLYAAHDRSADELVVAPTFDPDRQDFKPNPELVRLTGRTRNRGRSRGRLASPWRVNVIDYLENREQLPAIFFVFSRAGCDDAVDQCLDAGLSLTTEEESSRLAEIADRHTEGLSDHDLEALDASWWLSALRSGIAAHHAGIVPPMREAVEEAFAAGLVKVVFATETLAMGVNMPARTVVIEKLTKFTGETHEMLTPGEYTQITGRAGRRGIDEVGYALVCWSPYVPFENVASLASQSAVPLRSSFRPGYNMVCNLMRRHDEQEARDLLSRSFAQFHADREIADVEQRLERELGRLRRLDARKANGSGDIDEYRRLADALNESRRAAHGTRPESLRSGDIIQTGRFGLVVVLRPGAENGRATVVTSDGEAVKLGRRDLEDSADRGRVVLPTPIKPTKRAYRDHVSRLAASAELHAPTYRSGDDVTAQLRALEAHPAASDPQLEKRLDAAAEANRVAKRIAKLERRIARRSESLVRHLDRVLLILRGWGFVDDWELTPDGEVLTRLYSENDLLIADCIRNGLFDGLEPAELAALVSVFTFQRRGPGSDVPEAPRRWPSQLVMHRYDAIARSAAELELAEHDAGLPARSSPDPGLSDAVYEWVGGARLGDILEAEEISGGDLVRNLKQAADMLNQLADIAPEAATRAAAAAAVRDCQRGVVAASTFLS